MKIRVYGLVLGDTIRHEDRVLKFDGIVKGRGIFLTSKGSGMSLQDNVLVELVGSTLPSRDEWIKRAVG